MSLTLHCLAELSVWGADAVGGLKFIDGLCPGNDYIGVEAVDEVSFSLFQKRLSLSRKHNILRQRKSALFINLSAVRYAN